MCKIEYAYLCNIYVHIENRLKTNVVFMILSLLEGPDRKTHINSLCVFNYLEFIPGFRLSGVIATVRDLPSTRAGGQDDVSSEQTPSKYITV